MTTRTKLTVAIVAICFIVSAVLLHGQATYVTGATGTFITNAATRLRMTATNLLGRTSAGSGPIQEIAIGSGLVMTNQTLSATGGGGGTTINSTDGVIPVRGDATTFTNSPLSVETNTVRILHDNRAFITVFPEGEMLIGTNSVTMAGGPGSGNGAIFIGFDEDLGDSDNNAIISIQSVKASASTASYVTLRGEQGQTALNLVDVTSSGASRVDLTPRSNEEIINAKVNGTNVFTAKKDGAILGRNPAASTNFYAAASSGYTGGGTNMLLDNGTYGRPSGLPPGGAAGGDLTGTYPNPSTAKLNGVSVSSTQSSNLVSMEAWSTNASPSLLSLFTLPTRIVADGDSLTSSNNAWFYWFTNLHSKPNWDSYNKAVSGATITDLQSRYSTNISPLKPSGGTNAVLFAWAGVNDLFFNTNQEFQIINNLSNYWTSAKSDGFTLVAFTISDRSNFPQSSNYLSRNSINTFIRQSPTWDYLVDVDRLFPVADALLTPTPWYLDGIHFTTNAYRIISESVWDALSSTKRRNPTGITASMGEQYVGRLFGLDGAASLPQYSFNSDRGMGWSKAASGFMGASIGGVGNLLMGATQLRLVSDQTLCWSSANPWTQNPDTFIYRDSAAAIQLGADAASVTSPQTFKAADGSGTDKDGAHFQIRGGQSTGTGRGGSVEIGTSLTSTTGSTANGYSARFRPIAKFVDLTDAGTNTLISVNINTNNVLGIDLFLTVYATDGTNTQSQSRPVTIDSVNKAGTLTSTVDNSRTNATAASSGTLGYTVLAESSGTTNLLVRVTADSSLTTTTFRARVIVTGLNSDGLAVITEQ